MMPKSKTIPGEVFANVWDALEDTPAEAENMRLRSELMTAVQQAVEDWKVTPTAAAKRLALTVPRYNDLMRDRINIFNVDDLLVLAMRVGLSVQMHIEKAAA